MAKKQPKITEALDPIFEDDKNIMVYLDTSKLHPHPDNPRKDLGDLEELANSIKANGIMQNLTVVPRFENDTYTVIIGHRRLAAAKLAELDEVPCVIVDMTPQEQVATMLLENMQRSDLTYYEQAQGFQMMINFGESIESISEKTGFSQSTVRRRVKLAELDQDKLKKASEKQISLKDIERLNEIEDVNERNKLLGDLGTNSFEYRYNSALNEQKKKEQIQQWRDYLTGLGAIEVDDTDGYEDDTDGYEEIASKHITDYKDGHEALGEEMEEGTQYYFEFAYGYVNLLVQEPEDELADDEDAEKAEAEKLKQKKFDERKEKLREAFENAYKLRRKFIFDYSEQEAKKHIKEIVEFAINLLWCDDIPLYLPTYDFNGANELLLLGIDIKKDEYIRSLPYKNIKPVVDSTPYKSLLTHVYCTFSDTEIKIGAYDAKYQKNTRLDFIYKHLCALGYEMSDEEKALLDGTHEIYLTK